MLEVPTNPLNWLQKVRAAGFCLSLGVYGQKRDMGGISLYRSAYDPGGNTPAENQIALKLLKMVPCAKIDRIPWATTRDEAEAIDLNAVGVDMDFFSTVQAQLEVHNRVVQDRDHLHQLFDEKVEAEVDQEPEILEIQAARQRLDDLEAKTRTQKRAEREPRRSAFIYLADPEALAPGDREI